MQGGGGGGVPVHYQQTVKEPEWPNQGGGAESVYRCTMGKQSGPTITSGSGSTQSGGSSLL